MSIIESYAIGSHRFVIVKNGTSYLVRHQFKGRKIPFREVWCTSSKSEARKRILLELQRWLFRSKELLTEKLGRSF